MAQMSWRASDQLLERVREAAAQSGWSMNEYVTRVLEAATDPDNAANETERIRERLTRAGLLAPAGAPRRRPAKAQVARARRAAGSGTPLAQIVSDDRR